MLISEREIAKVVRGVRELESYRMRFPVTVMSQMNPRYQVKNVEANQLNATKTALEDPPILSD